MDVIFQGQPVHPNIATKKSLTWMQGIFDQYHHGIKAGSKEVVPPANGPWQQLPQCFEWREFINSEAAVAPDLLSGVQLAGISVKSVRYVLLLQRHKRPAAFDHNFTRGQFLPLSLPPEFTSGKLGTLQVWGSICLGKTEWALAQFDNPLLVTSRDSLRSFVPNFHDGIVLDKMVFDDWVVTDCESLTDFTQPAEIKVRYSVARIPKFTRKIVVSNRADVWPADPLGQLVGRRVVQLHIKSRLF